MSRNERGRVATSFSIFDSYDIPYSREQKHVSVSDMSQLEAPVHRGLSSTCWVLVRDFAIDMRFFGVIGFLCIKNTS